MKEGGMNRKLQEALIQDVIDGDCTPEDLVLFQECFRNEPEFRDLYYQYVGIDVLLSADYNQSLENLRSRTEHFREIQTRRNVRVAVYCAAAAVVLALFGAWFVHTRNAEANPHHLAGTTVVFGGDARWSLRGPDGREASPAASLEMLPGSTLKLDQGMAELSLPSGVRALVSGPAELSLKNERHVVLRSGKARFHVSKSGIGFAVSTPELRIVDLGTEFGVLSRDGEPDEVRVFRGRVEIQALADASERTTLSAGQALSVDPKGAFQLDSSLTDDYPESLAEGLPYLHWSFDSQQSGFQETEGTHPAASSVRTELVQAEGRPPDDRIVPGRFGQAASFGNCGDVVLTDFPGFSGAAPRTMAFWIRIPEDTLMHSDHGVAGWGLRHNPEVHLNEAWLFILDAQGDGTFVPRISFEGIWFTGRTDLGDGLWHHVACVYTGKADLFGEPEVRCYIDGKPESLACHWVPSAQFDHQRPARINTRIDAPNSVPFEIGTSLIPDITRGGGETFKGQIDEFFLIEGALDAETIRRLHRENRYVPGRARVMKTAEK
jgi:hypothetical protein